MERSSTLHRVRKSNQGYPTLPRRITPTEKYRRGLAAAFLDWVIPEAGLSVSALSKALSRGGSRRTDRRATIGAYRARKRLMTASVAAEVGDALRRLGVVYLNVGVALYGCGYFGEWVRYIVCLRRESYPAAIVETFATPDIGSPMQRALGTPTPGLPDETNAIIQTLYHDVPRSNLSRIADDVLDRASKRWFRGEANADPLVHAALAVDKGHDAPYLPENLCISLAISALSQIRDENDVPAQQQLFHMMYEAYYRRLPMLRPLGWPQPAEVRNWPNLTVGELEAALDNFLPAPRYEVR